MSAKRIKSYNLPHLDAAENIFFARETEFISRELFQVDYAKGMTRVLLPVDSSMDPSDDSFTWRQWNQVGKAKRIADDAADVAQANVLGEELNQRVDAYALGYSYTEDEIRKAAKLGRPLERDRAMAVREGLERQLNDIAAGGDSAAGLTGFLAITGANTATPSSKAASGVTTTDWVDSGGLLTATATEVLGDVNLLIRKSFVDSKEIEQATRVVMPTAHLALLAQTPRSDKSDVTILQFLKNNNPGVEFMSWERLKYVSGNADGLTESRLIAYDPRPEKLRLLLPISFEQQAPQLRNYRYRINCRMKTGGVICHKPLSVCYMKFA